MLPNQTKQSHLFTLRLWDIDLADGRVQWRGKLHHINTDEEQYFQEWSALIPLLLAMLRPPAPPTGNPNDPSQPQDLTT